MPFLCSLKVTAVSWGVTAALALTPARSPAQEPPQGLIEVSESNRRGFWLGLGLGAGGESFDLRPGVGYSDALYRPTVSLRLGGTVSPSLRLGGEVLSWINDVGPAVESLSSALFIAQLYPFPSSGLYLKGGIGIGRNAVDFDDGFDEGDTGFAGLIGAGYEIRLSRRFFLNPTIDLVGHRYDDGVVGDYQERLVNFGFGILLQTGR
jgi:hypothetical protein